MTRPERNPDLAAWGDDHPGSRLRSGGLRWWPPRIETQIWWFGVMTTPDRDSDLAVWGDDQAGAKPGSGGFGWRPSL